jgi:ABC-type oligopeptide transport system substrate-binding subunit
MHKAEEILVEEAPIASLYQSTRVYVQHPQLVGVLRRTIAPDPDFYYARIKPRVAKK